MEGYIWKGILLEWTQKILVKEEEKECPSGLGTIAHMLDANFSMPFKLNLITFKLLFCFTEMFTCPKVCFKHLQPPFSYTLLCQNHKPFCWHSNLLKCLASKKVLNWKDMESIWISAKPHCADVVALEVYRYVIGFQIQYWTTIFGRKVFLKIQFTNCIAVIVLTSASKRETKRV